MKKGLQLWWLFFLLMNVFFSFAQIKTKEITKQYQAWVSINSTARISNRWGFSADLHERRNNFLKDPSFYFARAGLNYWIKDNIILAAGYAHMWVASAVANRKIFTNENRIYQQVQMTSKISKLSSFQRLRTEQRWQQKIVDNKITGQNKFTVRIRYLLSLTVPVIKNTRYPSLVLSDELCVQFGKEIVYNTFDQNRVFLGVKQKLTKDFSFDLGYMLVKQKKSTGYQYDVNETFRCFFYYLPDWRKNKMHS